MNRIYAPDGVSGMILGMRRRANSSDEWRRVISEQATSGMSIAAYCRQRRDAEASFFAWRRKLRDPVQFAEVRDSVQFAEVRVAAEPLRPVVAVGEAATFGAASGIELRLANGRWPDRIRRWNATCDPTSSSSTTWA